MQEKGGSRSLFFNQFAAVKAANTVKQSPVQCFRTRLQRYSELLTEMVGVFVRKRHV
jgi:hypothetical protein